MMTTTAYIAYGLGEGKRHTRSFEQALQTAGYQITRDLNTADILIAHSGGVYADRPAQPPKLTVLINPSYPVDTPYIRLLGQKLWRDFNALRQVGRTQDFFIKGCWHIFYGLRYFGRTARMGLTYLRKGFLTVLPQGPIMIIQTTNDPWYTAPGAPIFPRNATLHTLPGEHDDCWLHPQPYIDLIQSAYKEMRISK